MSETLGPGLAAASFSATSAISTALPEAGGKISSSIPSIDISAPTHPFSGNNPISNYFSEPEKATGIINKDSFNSLPNAFESFSDDKSNFSLEFERLIDISSKTFPSELSNTPEMEKIQDLDSIIEIPDIYYDAFEDDAITETTESSKPTDQLINSETPEEIYEELKPITQDSIIKETSGTMQNPLSSDFSHEMNKTVASRRYEDLFEPDIEEDPYDSLEEQEIAQHIDSEDPTKLADEDIQIDAETQDTDTGIEVENDQEPEQTQDEEEEEEEEEVEENEEKEDPQKFVRDEAANAERKNNMKVAIDEAYETIDTSLPITGQQIVSLLSSDPSIKEVSEIVRSGDSGNNAKKDGSLTESRIEIAGKVFISQTDAVKETEKILDENTAVKKATSGEEATSANVARVIMGGKIQARIDFQREG